MTVNIERVFYRQAMSTLLGTLAAGNNNELGRVWFDALAEFESQISRLEAESNLSRTHARMMARRGPS